MNGVEKEAEKIGSIVSEIKNGFSIYIVAVALDNNAFGDAFQCWRSGSVFATKQFIWLGMSLSESMLPS